MVAAVSGLGMLIVRWPLASSTPLILLAIQYRPPVRRMRKAPPSLRLPSGGFGLPLSAVPHALSSVLEDRNDG